jgi:hypothetical protein
MKKLSFFVALAGLLIPTLSVAQSVFDGTWKIDMSNVDFSKKPDVFVQDVHSTLHRQGGW